MANECTTLLGITLDCRDNVGGIQSVFIQNATGSIAVGTPSNGAIAVTALQVDGTPADATLTLFKEYECVRQTGTLTETGTFSEENGTVFYTAVANTVFNKATGSKAYELSELALSTRLCVIVKDNNDKYWLVGNDRGALVSNSTIETGTAFGDRNGMTIEFTGIDQIPMLEVSGITV